MLKKIIPSMGMANFFFLWYNNAKSKVFKNDQNGLRAQRVNVALIKMKLLPFRLSDVSAAD